ncbi:hypothetical protein BAUCODRAFT_69791 [Baudoinia panamericana UAMH 10762]|uniref:ferric-chelate reductase (NADPH) n=1 Tax=Baudoinia panamericana (strain UAMH 10762) TaxID=717646 RepID=M2NBZ5_BAUPA|nr:uncharacterized protein BAUCODRAFT_69791 [Baudoinia panamericana UAMH 10762]EMC96689.1 hypothetical protein BAUCODRAFT_69791 [Baudoinia panamericana UAMH 10762]
MDMGGMSGGMDMGSEGLFTGDNMAIAHGYWYGIVAVTGLFAVARLVSIFQYRQRIKRQRLQPHTIPSRPRGLLSQCYATSTAVWRELTYAQPTYFTGKFSKYFSPLPIGHWILLVVYWTALLIMLWSNVILKPGDSMYAYKWEKVGFRAAWVTVAQIPFIYFLSMKFTPLTALTGISYERINWLHRWASRTVFLTAIIHWSFFLREWWLADFVQLEIEMMPMVKYGFGAFGTIAWMVLSGFGVFRAMNYELFVAQHIVAAALVLWLLYWHVPSYARYNIYMSIGFVGFDWGMRIIWNVLRNVHVLNKLRLRTPGYAASLESLPGDMVRLTIEDVDFSWRAGQHAYLSMPGLRPFELHPFTIANAFHDRQQRTLRMLIKSHRGFSKSLHKAAQRNAGTTRTYRVFLSGPWGVPPALQQYETVVLVAAASGASFIFPLAEELVRAPHCVRKIRLHWIIRSEEYRVWFQDTLAALMRQAQESGLDLQIEIHVTKSDTPDRPMIRRYDTLVGKASEGKSLVAVEARSDKSSSAASMSSTEDEKAPLPPNSCGDGSVATLAMAYGGRPTVEEMIRPPVEAALGETAVVVCGGLAITAQSRTFVAALSDERAVHKGTGAQGIYLFTETYGW